MHCATVNACDWSEKWEDDVLSGSGFVSLECHICYGVDGGTWCIYVRAYILRDRWVAVERRACQRNIQKDVMIEKLTDVTSRGRLRPGAGARPTRHGINLVLPHF
jgi:hypothetical protein